MKHPFLIVFALAFLGEASLSNAQTTIARWDFSDAVVGTTADIAASSPTIQGLTVSPLSESGGVNKIGVVGDPAGKIKVADSEEPSGPLYEVGMTTTELLARFSESSYSLNFHVTVGAGYRLTPSSLSFDLGYDTLYSDSPPTNYYAPNLQLYVSSNGKDWQSVDNVQTLAVEDPDGFTFPKQNDGAFFIANITISLADLPPVNAGKTLYFRLALAEGRRSDNDKRRIMLDNITLTGTTTSVP